MADVTQALFKAFKQDHATLGRGLHAIAERLRGRDVPSASAAADDLDRAAGAHMAFEEQDFYPALGPFLEPPEVAELYQEHADGKAAIAELAGLGPSGELAEARRVALLNRVEEMEKHVSECGELFGAMGGLAVEEQSALLARLEAWRAKAPRWTDLATPD